jgi:hypothetical protein
VVSVAAVAVLIVIFLDQHHAVPGRWSDWAWVAFGGVMVMAASVDATSGTTALIYREVQRTADPVGFWVSIVIMLMLGAGIVIGAAGALLGLWHF